jgi:hypothetical protein
MQPYILTYAQKSNVIGRPIFPEPAVELLKPKPSLTITANKAWTSVALSSTLAR